MSTILENLKFGTKNSQHPQYLYFCIQIKARFSSQYGASHQTSKLLDGILAIPALECEHKVVRNDFTILRRKSN